MFSNENLDHSEEDNEKPVVEEWRIHAVARQLEEAMHFEARPEFNTELRNRLLSEIKATDKASIQRKNRRKGNWPSFLAFPVSGWQAVVNPWLATLLVVVGLLVIVSLNFPAQSTPIQATATVSPEPEAEQENPVVAPVNEAPKKAAISTKVDTTADYWDEFQVQNQRNRTKKAAVVNSVITQSQEFNKKFKNGPLPVP